MQIYFPISAKNSQELNIKLTFPDLVNQALDWSCLSWNKWGNSTFLYVRPMMRVFMFSSPNFRFVLSIDNTYGPFSGRSFITILAAMSIFRTVCAMNRWIRRMLESLSVLLSKVEASFEKFTVYTLHIAQTIWDRHLIRLRFIEGLKWDRRIDNKSLILW